MTLRFVDSFDDRDTAHLDMKYVTASGSIVSGRHTSVGGLRGGTISKSIDAQNTWIVGFAYYSTVIPSSVRLVSFIDTADVQMYFTLFASGFIQAYRGQLGGDILLGTTTIPIMAGTWYYLEFKVTIDNATGSAVVHINEVEAMNLINQDTQATVTPSANNISITAGVNDTIDDLYICDNNGAKNNDFLGDNRIDAIFPDGDGTPATAEWKNKAGAASSWDQVDDNPPNDDTDYNYKDSTGLSAKDVWRFPAIPSTAGVVNGVQQNILTYKNDAGGAVLKNVCRSGGVDYESDPLSPPTASYLCMSSIWEQNPNGPVDWSIATINAAEFGYERVS